MALALEKYGRPSPVVAENGAWLLNKLAESAKVIPELRQRSSETRGNYAPGIIAVSFPPIPGEVLARVLSESGYAVSTGSACSHNKKGKLPKTMVAMNVPKDIATGMIRISIGPATSREELIGFLKALKMNVGILEKAVSKL